MDWWWKCNDDDDDDNGENQKHFRMNWFKAAVDFLIHSLFRNRIEEGVDSDRD